MRFRLFASWVVVALALITAKPARAASPVTDTQEWLLVQISGPVSGRIVAATEITVRAGDATRGVYQVEPLIGVGYKVSKAVTLIAGYGSILNRAIGGNDSEESRFYQQAFLKFGRIAGGSMLVRLRLEERDLSSGTITGYRARAMFRYFHPVHHGSKTSFVLAHESLINLNSTDWGVASGYGETRNFIGLRRKVAQHFDVEAGYLNQYQLRPNAADRMNHALFATLAFDF